MCILYGKCTDLFECIFDFHGREFKCCFQFFHWRDWMVAFVLAIKTMSGATFHNLFWCSWWATSIFYFSYKGFYCKYIIGVCKFSKLYDEFYCRGLWWRMVIQVAYDALYVGFELKIVVASLGTACAW